MEIPKAPIPLCDTCPMNQLSPGYGDTEREQARDEAIDLAFNHPTAPWKLATELLGKNHSEVIARAAIRCLGQIQLTHCETTEPGYVDTDLETFGAVARSA